MFLLIALSFLFSIAMCWHVVKSGREMYWLFIILAFQPLGGVVYGCLMVLPELLGGPTARRVGTAARRRLDPEREYREATARFEDSPTPGTRMKLAEAAVALGRHAEAEQLYAGALSGVHADDPALLLGRAKALIELGRAGEALPLLQNLDEQGRTPQAGLAMARALHALGRFGEADAAYAWAVERMPGFEPLARRVVFLAEVGRRAEADAEMAELERRAAKTTIHFRAEAHGWRDFAAASLG